MATAIPARINETMTRGFAAGQQATNRRHRNLIDASTQAGGKRFIA
jgi:hypothetical protein